MTDTTTYNCKCLDCEFVFQPRFGGDVDYVTQYRCPLCRSHNTPPTDEKIADHDFALGTIAAWRSRKQW